MLQSHDSLAGQSLSLLREQADKIKAQSRNLELKDQQIQFLKETILALEQEKDSLAHQHYQLRNKLKTMANEIAQYNSTVVHKIYQENQQLTQRMSELTQQHQALAAQRNTLLKRTSQLEDELNQQRKGKKESEQGFQKLREESAKNQKRLGLIEKQNKELQQKNISLTRQLEERSSQIAYCSQQIDVLTQKHHEALKTKEKQLKHSLDRMVPQQEVDQLEKELKSAHLRVKQLMTDLQRLSKAKDRLMFELTTEKQKNLNMQIKEQTETMQLRADIATLVESIKVAKKIAEFQSVEQKNVESAYDYHIKVISQRQRLTRALEQSMDQLTRAQSDAEIYSQKLKMATLELETLKQYQLHERESIEAEYENKLIEISIRLKKQEIALSGLRNKESALEALKEQFQREAEDRRAEKQALSHTISQLQKENQHLNASLSQALQVCDQTMLSRQCVTLYKSAMQDIVAVTHYLYGLLLQSKQRSKGLYAPFLEYYFQMKRVVDKRHEKKLPLRRLRACIWTVVATIRLKKQPGVGKGLQRHILSAVQRRFKIENFGRQVERISNLILRGAQVKQILIESADIYRWKEIIFQRIALRKEDQAWVKNLMEHSSG